MTARPAQRRPSEPTQTGADADSHRWYCGYCAGWGKVNCPGCGGFAGCVTCESTAKVACMVCSSGRWPKWTP